MNKARNLDIKKIKECDIKDLLKMKNETKKILIECAELYDDIHKLTQHSICLKSFEKLENLKRDYEIFYEEVILICHCTNLAVLEMKQFNMDIYADMEKIYILHDDKEKKNYSSKEFRNAQKGLKLFESLFLIIHEDKSKQE